MFRKTNGFRLGMSMLLVFLSVLLFVIPASAATVTIKNDIGFWQTTAGTQIHAQAGYIIKVNDTYWWYGRDGIGPGSNKHRIHAYSSTNLVDWKDEGAAATYETIYTACRPVVFYNAANNNYVMIVGLAGDGHRPRLSFLTSSTPGGTFTEVNRIDEPFGYTMGDVGGFTDNGNAYVVFNSDQTETNSHVIIGQLDANYTNLKPTKVYEAKHTNGNKREAFHVIKNTNNNKYYLFSSKTAGWNPSKAMYKSADSLDAFPTTGGNSSYNDGWNAVNTSPASTDSFDTQHDFILKINGTVSGSMWMYAGDRWPVQAGGTAYPADGGEKAWFPLTFSSGVPTIHGETQWTLNLDNATWAP